MRIAAETEKHVREAVINAAEYVGIVAANVVNTLHPELIVLGAIALAEDAIEERSGSISV